MNRKLLYSHPIPPTPRCESVSSVLSAASSLGDVVSSSCKRSAVGSQKVDMYVATPSFFSVLTVLLSDSRAGTVLVYVYVNQSDHSETYRGCYAARVRLLRVFALRPSALVMQKVCGMR